MGISTYAMHRIHQTKTSAAIRKLPLISQAAEDWWIHTQSNYFKTVCSEISATYSPDNHSGEDPPVPVPSFDEVVAKLPAFVLAGEEFSREMSTHCSTSKFLSYTAMKDSIGYQDIYAQILKNLRGQNIKILEIGIGVNPDFSRNVG